MKTRIGLMVIVLVLATLSGVACRGREREQPAAAPSATHFAAPPAQPQNPGVAATPTRTLPAQPQNPGAPATPTRTPPPTAQADLILAEATVTPTANQNEVRIHIVARKQGSGAITAAFTIRWHPHQKDKTQVGCSQDFYDLNRTEWVVDCTYTYPYNLRGEMHWVAVVDAENDVRNETNEGNNEKTGTITIAGGSSGPTPPPAGQAPPAPTNCKAVQVATAQIAVEWQFTGNADGFRIYQGKTSLEKTAAANARSVALTNLRPGVQYHFDVRAYTASGESRADACSVDVTPR